MNKDSFRKELEHPSNAYRSAPFWAWNGRMETQRIRQQIRDMKEQHQGGCFIHSREGLEIEYLSPKWMERVEDAVRYADQTGIDAWIYDEDKWPSGMAGGMITRDFPQYRAKALTLQRDQDGSCHFQWETSGDSEWYNGYGPANNLDPGSVRKFIDLTHEKYWAAVPSIREGKVRGFFTDEPNVCDFFACFTSGRPWLPWSDHMEEVFEKNRGYKIREHLEDLFRDGKDAGKIRHDYCKTITETFSAAYFEQLCNWLHDHHMLFTGHLLFENDLGYNARTSGAIMPHYRFFDIPGIDILGEQDQELLTVKQCTSVAHQFGKKHVMSETYGCTKWDFGLEGQKWLADWQFIQGVTMRCQHLFQYSIKGLRKRDYPPVFSEQTSWWEKSYILEDYYARFAVCSTYGKVKRDILVIHPQSTAWLHAGSRVDEDLANWDDNMGWTEEHFLEGNAIGARFQRIVQSLLVSHRDCDLGDEILLEQFGRVEGQTLYIQEAGYSLVLVPPMENIFSSTLDLLAKFADQGGKLVLCGPAPCYVDGESSHAAQALYSHRKTIVYASARAALDAIRSTDNAIEVVDACEREDGDILTMYREIPEGWMLICCNHDRERWHEVCIRMYGEGAIERIDLVTGESAALPVYYNEATKKTEFVEKIGAVETYVYILHKGKKGERKLPEFSCRHPHAAKPVVAGLEVRVGYSRDQPNLLPLDVCRYVCQGYRSDPMPVWQAQKQIREKLGMQAIYYNGAPQRYSWIYDRHENNGSPVELEFEFVVADGGVKNLKLAVEEVRDFDVFCNGARIYEAGTSLSGAYFLDPDIQTISIPKDCVRKGKNVLLLKTRYEQRMELEEIYLLGDFAVNRKRELEPEEETLLMGDWCSQGFPYYGGGMTYHFTTGRIPTGRPIGIHLNRWKGAVAEIKVNGQLAGHIGWKGRDGLDITPYLQEKNEIDVKVIASPRNIFGPFHQRYSSCIRSSYKDFRREGGEYTAEYILEPQGLMETVTLEELTNHEERRRRQ